MEVSKDDQQNINNFSKMNTLFQEKIAALKIQEKHLSDVKDAETELELLDETDLVK